MDLPMLRKCDEEDINHDDDSGFNNNSNYLLIIRRQFDILYRTCIPYIT